MTREKDNGDGKDLNPADLNIETRGKIGDKIYRVDQYGNQQSYKNTRVATGPKSEKQLAVQARYAQGIGRMKNAPSIDITSWRNKVTRPRNTYLNLFMQQVLNAYYQERASFNFIRRVLPDRIYPRKAVFKFSFDVPGNFQIYLKLAGAKDWQPPVDIPPAFITDDGGRFTLLDLMPDRRYCLMLVQPLTAIKEEREAELATIENQPPPLFVKGESGHYYFRTPLVGGAAARIEELGNQQ